MTPDECDFLIAAAGDSFTPAPVVGSGAGEVSASRTSSTPPSLAICCLFASFVKAKFCSAHREPGMVDVWH